MPVLSWFKAIDWAVQNSQHSSTLVRILNAKAATSYKFKYIRLPSSALTAGSRIWSLSHGLLAFGSHVGFILVFDHHWAYLDNHTCGV